MRRKVWAAVVALAMAASAIGLYLVRRDSGFGDDSPRRERLPTGPEIVVLYPHEPPSLSPLEESTAARDWLRPVLPTMLTFGPGGQVFPMVALGRPKVDGKNVRFELSAEAVWSDGQPITGNDVYFTWQAIRHVHPYDLIEDVRVSQGSVEIVLREPYPHPDELFSAGTYILPRHALQQAHAEGKLIEALVSGPTVFGGPFMIEGYTPGLEITLIPNPRWWGERPLAERVRIQIVGQFGIALELMEQKRADVIFSTTQVGIESRFRALQLRISSGYGSNWWELVMNTSRSSLDTVPERQVVAAAVDRRGIVEAFVRDNGRALNALAPGLDEVFGALEGGSGRGKLIFSVPSTDEIAHPMQRAIQTALSKAGIESDPTNPDPVRLRAWLIGGGFDIALVQMRTPPSGWLNRRFVERGLLNYSHAKGFPLDQKAIAEALPVLPIFEAKSYLAYPQGVEGPAANGGIDGPFWNLQDWLKQSPL